jgi:nicotinate-nucleotide--dimethylbenzimidazole phosphoribosyltransferase
MIWITPEIHPPCTASRRQALQRQSRLTKPAGSLGRLEALAVQLAAMQGKAKPAVDKVWISLFAADHGIALEGVSAFPQAVTRLMLHNFAQGGAAISVLSRQLNALLEVVDVGVAVPLDDCKEIIVARAGNGTANFARQAAMNAAQLATALSAGAASARRAGIFGAEIFIGGEMGIANSTSAAALACALLNAEPSQLAGPGTGLGEAGVAHKCKVIAQALRLHAEGLHEPMEILRRLGGFEIAALVGAYLQAASLQMPSLVDGFISSVAALLAVRLQPACADWLLYAHQSAEPGHRRVLDALGAQPILDLSMRLGEGSGAAVALPILRAACALHGEMATFEEAGITGR